MKLLFTFLLFLCVCHPSLRAQNTSEIDSVAIEQLTADVAHLRARADRWDRIVKHLPRPGGYLQAGYEGGTGVSNFMVKSVRVWLGGDLGTPKLTYMLQMELVSPRLLDAFVCYRPFAQLGVQVGEFKIPFSIENTDYSPVNAELIDPPLSILRLVAYRDMCGIVASGRDLGAKLCGDLWRREGRSVVSYDVAVINGEGLNTWDKNKSKDFAGRLMVRPVRGLLLAGYYYWGEHSAEYLKRIRYGGGFAYDRGRGVVRGEYVGGKTGIPEQGTFDSEGWYVLGGVRPAKGWLVAARYDTFTENRHDCTTRQTNYTAGVTWEPIKHLRCQLNYTYEQHKTPGVRNRNVVALLLTGIL